MLVADRAAGGRHAARAGQARLERGQQAVALGAQFIGVEVAVETHARHFAGRARTWLRDSVTKNVRSELHGRFPKSSTGSADRCTCLE